MFLSGIRRRPDFAPPDFGPPDFAPSAGFPWSVRLFARLESLNFAKPVTFLVGENGSGKSTLLEGLAVGMDAVAVGRRDLKRDETLAGARELARGFYFTRRRHPRARMFMRAEDVFGYTLRLGQEMRELDDIAAELAHDIPEGHGRTMAMGVARGQRGALAARYGDDPDAQSHGETFLALLQKRLAPRGLYFLDEPETPLSPLRVLALMTMIRDGVESGSQFVIATHSPILMALPGAEILCLDGESVRPLSWEEVEHVRVTRAFLNDPENYLRRL